MAKVCPACAYYNNADNTCRHDAPPPALTGSAAVVWPQVKPTDWCAQGWNPVDGYYEPAPSRTSD